MIRRRRRQLADSSEFSSTGYTSRGKSLVLPDAFKELRCNWHWKIDPLCRTCRHSTNMVALFSYKTRGKLQNDAKQHLRDGFQVHPKVL